MNTDAIHGLPFAEAIDSIVDRRLAENSLATDLASCLKALARDSRHGLDKDDPFAFVEHWEPLERRRLESPLRVWDDEVRQQKERFAHLVGSDKLRRVARRLASGPMRADDLLQGAVERVFKRLLWADRQGTGPIDLQSEEAYLISALKSHFLSEHSRNRTGAFGPLPDDDDRGAIDSGIEVETDVVNFQMAQHIRNRLIAATWRAPYVLGEQLQTQWRVQAMGNQKGSVALRFQLALMLIEQIRSDLGIPLDLLACGLASDPASDDGAWVKPAVSSALGKLRTDWHEAYPDNMPTSGGDYRALLRHCAGNKGDSPIQASSYGVGGLLRQALGDAIEFEAGLN